MSYSSSSSEVNSGTPVKDPEKSGPVKTNNNYSNNNYNKNAPGRDMEKNGPVNNNISPVTSKPLVLGNIVEDPIEATVLYTADNPCHPMHWNTWYRYFLVIVYCSLEVFVSMTSTTYVAAEILVEEKWNVKPQVATLGQSMFILGNAIGPAFMGPLSDISGRKWVYVFSTLLYVIFNFGTAYARNMPMMVIFMFLIGMWGSCSLCNVAGTVGDLFGVTDEASQALSLFIAGANVGPSIGSVIGEAIVENESLGLKWIFLINIIIGSFFMFALMFIPETLPSIVIRERQSVAGKKVPNVVIRELKYFLGYFTGKKPEWAQVTPGGDAGMDEENAVVVDKVDAVHELKFVLMMAFKMMVTEPIIIFLGLFNGFAYGLLFLYLDGIFDVFVFNNGLSYMAAQCTYLNFVVGVMIVIMLCPIQTWLFKRDRMKNGGIPRPEARFQLSLITVWFFPISMYWFAFTSDGNTSYWSPIIAGTFLGIGDPITWLAMVNFITDAYSEAGLSGSAIAAFTIPSFAIAAALSHAGVAMFENMSTKWAFFILATISLCIVALTYIFYFMGPRIRAASKLARISGTI
ncbi:unnamed protein product [Ambrosiozyma monospora]|uniref:Unnamed protein product n=1 Tax=Ambrosiozyma monospora TaxID=43982 RepID=A0A9W6YV51_AMBMO|nr:unnamed protein product [Ambrosiozyma monospora]